MLETKKLDDLSCLLKEMTRPGSSHPKFTWLLYMERLLVCALIGLFALAFLRLSSWSQHPGFTPSRLREALFVVDWLFEALLYYILPRYLLPESFTSYGTANSLFPFRIHPPPRNTLCITTQNLLDSY
jgi:hypothetical protein